MRLIEFPTTSERVSTIMTERSVVDSECVEQPCQRRSWQSSIDDGRSQRLIPCEPIRMSELIAALSCALDITQGHPQGHSMRTALIGMRISQTIKLDDQSRSNLFYTLLLKDLGCSSNAAKIAYLFGGDDHVIKRSLRLIDWTNPQECLRCCWNQCAPGTGGWRKLSSWASLVFLKSAELRRIGEIRCDRGARIAQMLGLPDAVANGVYHLDELWNGRGTPDGLKGDAIPLLSRICGLSQAMEVYARTYGVPAALQMVRKRRGKWFDPVLVDAVLAERWDGTFGERLPQNHLAEALSAYEPQELVLRADEAMLDRIANAFAMVVDAKSPWTYRHSTRVAEIADGIAGELGYTEEVRRDIRRAALLHDLGKLGVSNTILDKPGKPTDEEYAQIKRHAFYTQQILSRVGAFSQIAFVAAAHHERLDGRGYHLGISDEQIPFVSRMLMAADIFEALSAQRPYREAMDMDRVRMLLKRDIGQGPDGECVEALFAWHDRVGLVDRIDDQFEQLEAALAAE